MIVAACRVGVPVFSFLRSSCRIHTKSSIQIAHSVQVEGKAQEPAASIFSLAHTSKKPAVLVDTCSAQRELAVPRPRSRLLNPQQYFPCSFALSLHDP